MSLHPRSYSWKQNFSREGFKPLPNQGDADGTMATHDATIDIPLEQVTSYASGYRSQLKQTETNSSDARRRWRPRGRRQKPDSFGRQNLGEDGEEITVNTMGKIYKKILNFSTLTRYFFYVLPLASIIAIPIIIYAVNNSKAQIGGVRVYWFFTWIEIVWLSLWISKTFAHYLPPIFRVMAGVVSSGVRKYSEVIKSLEIPLSLVGWALASLATFKPIMIGNPAWIPDCQARENTQNPTNCLTDESWINTTQTTLGAALIGSIIFAAEKLIIQLISVNYHRKQFNARIKESKRNLAMLGLLYDASRELFPMYCSEFAEEDYTIADQLDLSRASRSKRLSKHFRSGSQTPLRFVQDIGHAADKITSMFGHMASEVTGKQVFNPNSAHSIVVEALEKNRTAEALAKRIWMSLVVEGRESLSLEDVIDVLGPERREQAEEAFWTFDQDGNGDVSLDEFILTVTQFGRDRKSIASSLHDVDQAIHVLDQLLVVVAFAAIVLVFVALLNKNFQTTLATLGTALISLSFAFSTSAQEVLGCCIFVFVKHPYDIGDRVDIGTAGCLNQQQLCVEHISLMFTVFRHVRGEGVGRLSQIPNILLNTLWIENVSRSKAMTEQLSIDIAFETSFEDLQTLKTELLSFVTDKDNSRDYQPTIDLDVLGTSDQSKMSLMVEVKHKSNWANESVRRTRRTKFMCALISALKTVPIYPPGGAVDAVGSAALPAYSVAISHDEAKVYADEAAEAREKARLIPTKKIEESRDHLSSPDTDTTMNAGITKEDEKAISKLHTSDPAVDPVRDDMWARDDGGSTLGERPSIERSDLDEVRGMLRRESTRGKRKPSQEYHPSLPPIPTINEPGASLYGADSVLPLPSPAQAHAAENQRPSYSTMPYQYRQRAASRPTQYQPGPHAETIPEEMSEVPANTYRVQTNNSQAIDSEDGDDKNDNWGNSRPYSGV